ncbi:MAG: PRK06851 family protein [Sarcina sp.]
MGNFINYFAATTTAKGFKNFYDSVFLNLEKIYILNNGSNKSKSIILEKLGSEYINKYNIEVINSSLDENEIEAIVIRELKIAFFNGNLIHAHDLKNCKARKIYIDLTVSMDMKKIISQTEKIENLKSKIIENIELASGKYREALILHGEIEKYYIKSMDFEKANEITNLLMKKLINRKKECSTISSLIEKFNNEKKDFKGTIYDRYLGGATSNGSVDFVMNITENLKRYFIKGRSGTGKSTILRKIAKKAVENGFDVELYHCGFDPDSIDMVVVRELNFAIFDSTAPHEYFPTDNKDEVIDTYKGLCISDVDNEYKNELDLINKEMANIKKEAQNYLKKVTTFKGLYDKIFEEAQDLEIADSVINEYLKNKL